MSKDERAEQTTIFGTAVSDSVPIAVDVSVGAKSVEDRAFLSVAAAAIDPKVRFMKSNQVIAEIGADDIFRFTVDPTDENTLAFIECIERLLNRRIAGVAAYHPAYHPNAAYPETARKMGL